MSDPGLRYYARDALRQYRSMRVARFSRKVALTATLGDFLRGLRAKYVRRVP